MKRLEGAYTVCITPFTEDGGEVDFNVLRAYVNWQIDQGIHGLMFLGSTGEFLSVSNEERRAITEAVIETASGRVPIVMGTGHEDTREVVRLSKEAESLGADGLLIIPPFYSTPTEDELFIHYKTVAESVSIPIMVYNNPATSNVDLLPHFMARLAEVENLDYMKESTMDVTRIRDIHLLCGEKMTVFGGIMGFESFVEGAKGWVSVASNVMPKETADIYDLVKKGNVQEAWDLYIRILPIIQFVFGIWYVGGTKALLNTMGLPVGPPRPPRQPAPFDLQEKAKTLVDHFNLSFSSDYLK